MKQSKYIKMKSINNIKKIVFKKFKKNEESLYVYSHSLFEIPFQIKRVFVISDVLKFSPRGSHAHKNTQQVFISLKGKITFKFFDGLNKRKISLNKPNIGIIKEIENREKITDKVLQNVFSKNRTQ